MYYYYSIASIAALRVWMDPIYVMYTYCICTYCVYGTGTMNGITLKCNKCTIIVIVFITTSMFRM